MVAENRRAIGRYRLADILCLGSIALSYIWSVVASLSVAYTLAQHPVGTEAFGGTTISMITSGGLVSAHRVWLLAALAAPIFAIFRFSPAYWWAGHRFGHFFIDALSLRNPRAILQAERAERMFRRRGGWAVVFAYFLPIPNSIIFALAGWSGMSLVRFILFSLLDASLYAGLMVGLGFGLGNSAIGISHWVSTYVAVLLGLVFVSILAYYLMRRRRRSRVNFQLASPEELMADPSVSGIGQTADSWRDAPLEELELELKRVLKDATDGGVAGTRTLLGGFTGGSFWLAQTDGPLLQESIFIDLGRSELRDSTLSTVWEVGSISQTLTGTFLADLMSDGCLNGEERLDEIFRETNGFSKELGELTLLSLGTNSSGLPQLTPRLFWRALASPKNPYSGFDLNSLFASIGRRSIAFRQGVDLKYSQVGYALLGAAISRRLGDGFVELLAKHFKQRYGLAIGGRSLSTSVDGVAVGYKRGRPMESWDAGIFSPAVGLSMDIGMLLRWCELVLSLGAGVELAQRPWLKALGAQDSAGIGWLISGAEGNRSVTFQAGEFGGFSSAIAVNRSTQSAVFAISNVGSPTRALLCEQLCLGLVEYRSDTAFQRQQ